jgi:hypothetical protein
MLYRLVSFLVGLQTVFSSIRDCGNEMTSFKLTELSQTPRDSIRTGENLTLTLKYEVPSRIPMGTSQTSVSLNFIPLGTKTEELCSTMPCPIEPGIHDGSSWALFPSGVSGTLVTKINWYDDQQNHLLCLESVIKASSSFRKNQTLEFDEFFVFNKKKE